jgi:DNA-binding SARP family transcriptional activator
VLLAVLAMSAGRPVGADRLAGLLWDDDRPEHPRASLHTVVARLRTIAPRRSGCLTRRLTRAGQYGYPREP